MNALRNSMLSALCLGLTAACGQARREDAGHAARSPLHQPVTVRTNPARKEAVAVPEHQQTAGLRDKKILFKQYLLGYDEQDYAHVFYKLQPNSAWTEVWQGGRSVTADTANVDKQGKPELLLTVGSRSYGSGNATEYSHVIILRTEHEAETLFEALIYYSEYNHPGQDGIGEATSVIMKQKIVPGYGFIRVRPVETKLALAAKSVAEDSDIAPASFLKPGIYRWRNGGLKWTETAVK